MVFIAYGYNTTLICTKLYCRFDKILFCIFYHMWCNFAILFCSFNPKSKLCCRWIPKLICDILITAMIFVIKANSECLLFFCILFYIMAASLIFYSSCFFIFFNPFVYHISSLGISPLLDCFLNTSKFIVHFHYSYLFLFAISHLIFPFLLVQLFVRTFMLCCLKYLTAK